MDDLISREAAIDALRYAQHRFTVADEAGGMGTVKWSEDVIYFAAAERVLTDLPSAQPEQRWIPCSKRLPEAGVRYQVTFESGEVGYADFRNKIFLSDGSAKENVWETERYYEDDGEVIAWMPLPEPYKGE